MNEYPPYGNGQEPPYEQPVQQPIYEQPVYEQPVYEQPVQQPAYGQAYYEAPQAAGSVAKAGISKGLLIGLIAGGLALLGLAAFLIFGGVFSSSPAKVNRGLKSTATSLTSFATDMVKQNTSVSVQVDTTRMSGSYNRYGYTLEDLFADLPIAGSYTQYSNANDGKGAALLNLSYDGSLLADAAIYYSSDELALSSSVLLDGDNYGISLKNLSKNLPGSFLDPDGDNSIGTYLGRYVDGYDLIFEWLCDYNGSGLGNFKDLSKQSEKLAEEFLDVLFQSLEKHGQWEDGQEQLSLGGQDINTQKITLIVDAKAFAAVGEDIVQWAKRSREMDNFFNQLDKTFHPLFEASGIDMEDVKNAFRDALEEYDAEDVESTLGKTTLTFNNYLYGGKLVRLDIRIKSGSDKVTLSLAAGPDPAKPHEIGLVVDNGYQKTSFSYLVDEDNGSQYHATYKLKSDSSTLLSGALNWDKNSGDFKASLKNIEDSSELMISGIYTVKGQVTTLVLKELQYEQYGYQEADIEDLGTTIVIDRNATLPAVPAYTDILTLDEEELAEVLELFVERINELAEEIDAR